MDESGKKDIPFRTVHFMKRSILGLMYLIQGMRKAGVDVDAKLQSIGLCADALDTSSVIHPSLEWDILNVIGADVEPETGCLLDSIMLWQVMVHY